MGKYQKLKLPGQIGKSAFAGDTPAGKVSEKQ